MAGSIVISLLLATGAFETDSKRAERRLQAFRREAAKVGKAVATAFVAAGAAVVATFTAMIQQGREVIDSQAKIARQLNTTVRSVQVLTKAGTLAGVSFEKISTAARQLDVNLGRAAQGASAQADALEQLNLQAVDLAGLPLDERISAINRALRDNVSTTERAAVAAELFGARNAQAIQQLDNATIAEGARLVELFGVALDDVSAAKVELANDALGNLSLAAAGARNQLTVLAAPVLRGLGLELERAAEEAGGLGNVITETFDDILIRGAKVADTFVLITRRLMAIAAAEQLASSAVEQTFSRIGRLGADLASLIPGIDASELREEFEANAIAAEASVAEAMRRIEELLTAPLPSDSIQNWIAEQRADAERAARELSLSEIDLSLLPQRRELPDAAGAGRGLALPRDAIGDEILADLDVLIAGFDEAARFVASTRTEVERLEAKIARVRELAAAGFLPPGQAEEVLDRFGADLEAAQARLQEGFEEYNEFMLQASRNTQDIIADTLVSGFDDGLSGIADSFTKMITRLTAEALAADLAGKLFGDQVGGSGGLIGAAGEFLGGIFGGGRATGGPVRPGVTYRINELEPEFFRPATSGQVVPLSKMPARTGGGDVTVQQTINVQGRPDQRTASQIAVETQRRQRIATARLG